MPELTGRRSSPKNKTENASPEPDDQILNLIDQVVLNEFPNPDRKGCPQGNILESIAYSNDLARKRPWINHIMQCSPCAREYDEYRKNWQKQQKIRKNLLLVAATLILAVGIWIIFAQIRSTGTRENPKATEGQPPPPDIAPAPASPPESNTTLIPDPVLPRAPTRQVVKLDIRDFVVYRSESKAPSKKPNTLALKRGLLDVAIYLPLGSEDGKYEVQVFLEEGKPLVTAVGTAETTEGDTVLRAKIDTSKLAVGNYSLGIRQLEQRWKSYPVEVR